MTSTPGAEPETIIATGRKDAPDLAYHAAILTALASTLTALWRRRDAAGLKPARAQPAESAGSSAAGMPINAGGTPQ